MLFKESAQHEKQFYLLILSIQKVVDAVEKCKLISDCIEWQMQPEIEILQLL